MLSATPLQKGLAGITALSGLTLLPKLVEELQVSAVDRRLHHFLVGESLWARQG